MLIQRLNYKKGITLQSSLWFDEGGEMVLLICIFRISQRKRFLMQRENSSIPWSLKGITFCWQKTANVWMFTRVRICSKRIFKTCTQFKHISETVPSINYQLSKAALHVPTSGSPAGSDIRPRNVVACIVSSEVQCLTCLQWFYFSLVFITLGMNKGTCALLNLNF